jgi:hypothetical protein
MMKVILQFHRVMLLFEASFDVSALPTAKVMYKHGTPSPSGNVVFSKNRSFLRNRMMTGMQLLTFRIP